MTSSGSLPRMRASSVESRSCFSASIVAWATFRVLALPWFLVRMSRMPAAQHRALGPPAITPVPGDAGLSTDRASTTDGIACGDRGNAHSTPDTMYGGRDRTPCGSNPVTPRALPMPRPTRPIVSPTTTTARKARAAATLSTLETRVISITRSSSSSRHHRAAAPNLVFQCSLQLSAAAAGKPRSFSRAGMLYATDTLARFAGPSASFDATC